MHVPNACHVLLLKFYCSHLGRADTGKQVMGTEVLFLYHFLCICDLLKGKNYIKIRPSGWRSTWLWCLGSCLICTSAGFKHKAPHKTGHRGYMPVIVALGKVLPSFPFSLGVVWPLAQWAGMEREKFSQAGLAQTGSVSRECIGKEHTHPEAALENWFTLLGEPRLFKYFGV